MQFKEDTQCCVVPSNCTFLQIFFVKSFHEFFALFLRILAHCVTCGPNENYWPLWPQIVTISHHLFLCGTFKILNIKKKWHIHKHFFREIIFLGGIRIQNIDTHYYFFREIIFTKISLTWFLEKKTINTVLLILIIGTVL